METRRLGLRSPWAIRVRGARRGQTNPGGLLSFALLLLCLLAGAGEVQVARRPRLTSHTHTHTQGAAALRADPRRSRLRPGVGRSSWEAVGSDLRAEAEAPSPVVRSLSPDRAARDDEAGKVRRARREAARHAPRNRQSVFSAVAQTLLARQSYSTEGSPGATRCSSSPGRIRAPQPVRTRPARPLRTLLLRPSSFPSPRLPLREGRSSPLQSSLTTRGTTSTRRWGEEQECAPPLGLPPRRANSADESE